MTRTLRFGRWPSGVRIAVLMGLSVVVPCVLLVLFGIRSWRTDRGEARAQLRERLEETLRRDVVDEVRDHLDRALRDAAGHFPADDPEDPDGRSYLRSLEGSGGPFQAVFVVTREDRVLDSSGSIVRAPPGDAEGNVDAAEVAALVARIRGGEAGPADLAAFAAAHPLGLDADDYPVTLGFLDLRTRMLVDAGSPKAAAALLDLETALIRHSRFANEAHLADFRRRADAHRGRLGDDAALRAGIERLDRVAGWLGEIDRRVRPRRNEFLATGTGHDVVAGPGGRTVFSRVPVPGASGEAPRFLLVLVLDRAALERAVIGPALTSLDLPGGLRAVPLGGDDGPPGDSVVVMSDLAPPIDDIGVAIVAENAAALDAAARSSGGRNLVVLVLAIAGAAAAGFITIRTVSAEIRLAKRTSDFVSNVTHELKTPLTAIRMFVETLQDGRVRDDGERRECLDVIARETGRLQDRIERVLKLARLGAGKSAFDMHPGSLTDVLRQAADTCRARLAGIPGAELIEEIEDDLGPLVFDGRAMGEAVSNLLANATKYSPRDRCRLRLTGRKSGGEVVVEVGDQGFGIPASEHERIFERFYRVDQPRVQEVEGTGLGLALVRRIVEAHRGRMSLSSTENEGSTFRIHLPTRPGIST